MQDVCVAAAVSDFEIIPGIISCIKTICCHRKVVKSSRTCPLTYSLQTWVTADILGAITNITGSFEQQLNSIASNVVGLGYGALKQPPLYIKPAEYNLKNVQAGATTPSSFPNQYSTKIQDE